MEIRNLNLPQLIVALDSENDDANYVHIRDVCESINYYCPCCKRTVKPRAYKNDREYYMQPHFFHSDGCCSEESRVHWLYKNWLFKEGSKFEVNGTVYDVSDVDIEEPYNTSFGGYKPDITVFTKEDKKFFFEINFTNAKKEDDYFCKWSELNVDVVEVDVKKLLNSDYTGGVPVFELIYSDGVCYKKDYEKRDLYASTIGVRKLEWKRQDKINYKMMWEKLDWFWQELQRYKEGNVLMDKVLESFSNIPIQDKELCFDLVKKHSCIKDNIQKFRDIINIEVLQAYKNELCEMVGNNFELDFEESIIEPRRNIVLEYEYTTKYSFVHFDTIVKDNREWILRYEDMLDICDQIKQRIELQEQEDLEESKFKIKKKKCIMQVKEMFNRQNCIWCIKEISDNGAFISFTVGIKNGFENRHSSSNSVRVKQEDSYECIVAGILSNMVSCMNSIRSYIYKYDGYDRDYRYMFISKEDK